MSLLLPLHPNLRVTLRNLLRHRAYTAINIAGLSVSMACCILLLLFVRDELSYDRHHEKLGQIHRILRETRAEGQDPFVEIGTSGSLAAALEKDFPEVQTGVRFLTFWGHLRYGDKGFTNLLSFVDPKIFEVFDIRLIRGDRATALSEPLTAFLSEKMVDKHFGDRDPIGEVITLEHDFFTAPFVVKGVFADIPSTASFRFNCLMVPPTQFTPPCWTGWMPGAWRPVQTYVVLPQGYDPEELERKLPNFMAHYMGDEVAGDNTYHVQPLSRVHLYSMPDYGIGGNIHIGVDEPGDIDQVFLFGGIAFLVLLIACINFVNLATARAMLRTREVGIRKAVGAQRGQLARQFLGESALLVVLSCALAIGLVELALPEFNGLVFKQLVLDGRELLFLSPYLLALMLIVGLLAGGYPALYLSGLKPVDVLKGRWRASALDAWLRKGLVVSQFAVSTLLLVCTGVVYYQVDYMSNHELGFDKEHVVTMGPYNKNPQLRSVAEVVKSEFLQHPGVLKGTIETGDIPGGYLVGVRPEGYPEDVQMYNVGGDGDFLDVYGIELVAGRNIAGSREFLLNEAAVARLGWDDPLGKEIAWKPAETSREIRGRVVGVMRDFHFHSFREKIGPAFMVYAPFPQFLTLRLRPDNLVETMEFLRERYEERVGQGFYYWFLDDSIDNLYRVEQRAGRILFTFAGLAIFVACLGVVGLASFAAQRRTKEIGIRKVLGASVRDVVVLLSRDFAGLVLVANLIAWPVAYWAMSGWLQNFVYRMELGPIIFILSGASVLIVVLLAVGVQTVRAGLANPVEALRYE
ncbi:MAG: FtsX-like permease family protein [Gemmatimonadetes bacterium]|nr:FtsX-like permease family protein [Gemmatimonadota bacterium]